MNPLVASRVRFLQHDNQPILQLDFGLEDKPLFLETIAHARAIVGQQAKGSVRLLVQAAGARFDPEVIQALQRTAEADKPFVRATAVVGMTALHRIVFRLVMQFTGRTNLRAFDTDREALAWLVAQ